MDNQCKVLPPHSHILVCLGLINSVGLTLMIYETLPHHKGVQAPSAWQLNLVYPRILAEYL